MLGDLISNPTLLEICPNPSQRSWASVMEEVNRGYKYKILGDVVGLKKLSELNLIPGYYGYGNHSLKVCERVCEEASKRLQPLKITEIFDKESLGIFEGLEWEDINGKMHAWYGSDKDIDTNGKERCDMKNHLQELKVIVDSNKFPGAPIEVWIEKLARAMDSMDSLDSGEEQTLSQFMSFL